MFVHPVWRGQERTDESSHTSAGKQRTALCYTGKNGGNRRVEEVEKYGRKAKMLDII